MLHLSSSPLLLAKWIYLAIVLQKIHNLLLLYTFYMVTNFALSRLFDLDKPYFELYCIIFLREHAKTEESVLKLSFSSVVFN